MRNRSITHKFVTEQLHDNMRRDVFQAIADPVRRDIIGLLANDALTVNAVAENFEISRPAISKHIRILNECGVIVINQKGRERYCKLLPQNLTPVADWVEPYRRLWEEKLDSFEQYLAKIQTKNKANE